MASSTLKGLGANSGKLGYQLWHRPLKMASLVYEREIGFAGTHLYTWVERGTVRVKCLAQEHNTMSRPGLEPGALAPKSNTLTMRPPRLHVHKELADGIAGFHVTSSSSKIQTFLIY